MKKIAYYLIALVLTATTLSSCYKDNSNTNLGKGEIITIEGIADSYTVSSAIERLEISPEVTFNQEGDYSYAWYYFNRNESSSSGEELTMTLISETKDLSYVFAELPKTYQLVLQVTNNVSGYVETKIVDLNIITEFTRGWFVLKDNGTETDLDMFKLSDEGHFVEPGVNVASDLIKLVNGESMKGQALDYMYLVQYPQFDEELGLFDRNFTGFMIATTEDIRAFSPADMSCTREAEGMFLGDMANFAPEMMYNTSSGNTQMNIFYVQEGLLQCTGVNQGNNPTGMFGGNLLNMMTGAYDYQLAPFAHHNMMGVAMYDQLTGSFMNAGYNMIYAVNDMSMMAPVDPVGTSVSPINTGLEMVYMEPMGAADMFGMYAVGCIMQAKDGSKYTYKMQDGFTRYLYSMAPITAGSKLDESEVIAFSKQEQRMYFAVDNVVYTSMFSTNSIAEDVLCTLPEGEKVVYMRHEYIAGAYGYEDYGYVYYDHLVIASIEGEGASATYTVRFYPRLSGGLVGGEAIDLRLTGHGVPADMHLLK